MTHSYCLTIAAGEKSNPHGIEAISFRYIETVIGRFKDNWAFLKGGRGLACQKILLQYHYWTPAVTAVEISISSEHRGDTLLRH